LINFLAIFFKHVAAKVEITDACRGFAQIKRWVRFGNNQSPPLDTAIDDRPVGGRLIARSQASSNV
jgi:hypothetical protein